MLKFNTVRITHRPWMDIPLEYPQSLLEADTNGFDYTGFNLAPSPTLLSYSSMSL